MTVSKKSRPTYILLTIEEQLSLSFALFNLNLGSLARCMRPLSGTQGSPWQGKPGLHTRQAFAGTVASTADICASTPIYAQTLCTFN